MQIVILWLLLAGAIGMWASARGHNWFAGFFIAAVLSPVVGAIIIAATPDRRAEARHAELLAAMRGPNGASDTRPCPRCAETIKRAAKVCRFCQAEVEPLAAEPQAAPPPPPPSKGLDGAVMFAAIFLVVAIVVAAGVSQLGKSANATFTTISGSM